MDEVGWIRGAGTSWFFQCSFCKHLQNDWSDPRCAAYPEGIPTDILYNRVDHRDPLPGDHGIRFEALPGDESPFAFAAQELADTVNEAEAVDSNEE